MGYYEFLTLINQNTENQFDYKSLCRFCLQKKTNGINISHDSDDTKQQKEHLLKSHHIITKEYLSISPKHPNFVCTSCESNLNEYASFIQQVIQNDEYWEIFLKRETNVKIERNRDSDNIHYHESIKECNPMIIEIEEIKIEYCENNLGDVTDSNACDVLDIDVDNIKRENGVLQRSSKRCYKEVKDEINGRKRKRNKRSDSKPIYPLKTTDYERTCKHCDEPTFSSMARFYEHQLEKHPGEKAFSCDICSSKFSQKKRLVIHMKERHDKCGKNYQCQFCAKLFFSDRELNGHEKIHVNARQYVCKLCGKRFNQKTILNIHLKSKAHNVNYRTKPPKKIYKSKKEIRCHFCIPSIVFESREELSIHRNVKHKTFECDVCKNSFMAQESLDSHKLKHSEKPRPFVCEVCNATFNQSSHLSSHFKRKHTENKAFNCSHCDRSFFEGSELTAHINLRHKKQKRVKCDECACDFATEKYLKKHKLAKHTLDILPYDCKICGKRNPNGAMLDLHRSKHH